MICTSCGTTNRDDAQFCRGCGNALTSPQSQPPTTPRPPSSPLPPDSPPAGYPGYQSQFPPAQPTPPYNPSYANYQAPMPAGASGKAIASLILSIVSIFTCGPLLSIPGMIIGKLEMTAITQGKSSPAGMGYAKAGFWIGVIVTALSCLVGILYFVLIALGIAGSALQQ